MRIVFKITIICALVFLIGGCVLFAHDYAFMSDTEMAKVYFTEKEIPETEAYEVYKNQYKDEMAKVQYLTNLVRYSPLTFSRNNKEVPGHVAGQWLDFKIDLYQNEIETVNDFVEKVASYSRRTGRPYYVIIGDKKCYMKNVYYNELERLAAYESDTLQLEKGKKERKETPRKPQVTSPEELASDTEN